MLYRVIDEHLETFLDTAQRHADGLRLPAFVEQEFRDFLTCGVLALGFARLRCAECAFERLVPFSCKGRGFCLSCGGRRLGLLADGRVVLTLKTAWADGTRQLVFEPMELLEKLAALTPRPRINLVLYHGVLAPHACWRARVVAYGAPPVEGGAGRELARPCDG